MIPTSPQSSSPNGAFGGLSRFIPPGLVVALGALGCITFLWIGEHDDEWFDWIRDGMLERKTALSFLEYVIGYVVAAFALWWVGIWRLQRMTPAGTPFDPRAARQQAARPFYWLWLLWLFPTLAWEPLIDWPAHFFESAVLAVFIASYLMMVGFEGFAAETAPRAWYQRPVFWMSILAGLVAVDRTLAGFWRYWAFQSNMDDCGLYHQMLWGLTHGEGFHTTIYEYASNSFLSEHMMPSVALLLPFYWVYNGAEVLYVAQTFFVLLGGVFLVLIARERTRAAWFPFVALLVYLLYPALERGWVVDFHADMMEIPFYLGAWYFLITKRYVPYWIALIALLGCKEDVGLAVTAFGFWIAVFERRWRTGLATMVAGFAWSFVCIVIILPQWGGVSESPFIQNYAHLGDGVPGIIQAFLFRPHEVLYHLFQTDRVESMLKILFPLAFISLGRPSTLLLLIPVTVTTILSGWERQMTLSTHYGLVFVAPAFIGLVEGWRTLEARWERQATPRTRRSAWAVALIVCAVASHLAYAKYPLTRPAKWAKSYQPSPYREQIRSEIFALLDADATVAAQNYIGDQLSFRKWIRKFPKDYDSMDYVLLDMKIMEEIKAPEYWEALESMRQAKTYGLVQRVDTVVLLQKGRYQPDDDALYEELLSHRPNSHSE